MTLQVATANRLSDGIVVFLGYDGEWSRHVDDARIAERDDDMGRNYSAKLRRRLWLSVLT